MVGRGLGLGYEQLGREVYFHLQIPCQSGKVVERQRCCSSYKWECLLYSARQTKGSHAECLLSCGAQPDPAACDVQCDVPCPPIGQA